ncbi:MAG: hypothetical protein JRH18_23265 [Deltaproteobacteria bacterium]|nr:hypothetical protein [Deltaproteobacteria bacterium]
MNVLFVCTANISRSYLAEKIMKHTAERFGLKNIEVSSAGVNALPGSAPDPMMVEYLKLMNIPFDNHESRQLDTESVEWADVILVMEQRHKNWIQTLWPWPYGSSLEEYQVAQSQITMAVEALARLIYEEMRHAGNGA